MAMSALAALGAVVDSVDYIGGACSPTEMVGALLDRNLLICAREIVGNARMKHQSSPDVDALRNIAAQLNSLALNVEADGEHVLGAELHRLRKLLTEQITRF